MPNWGKEKNVPEIKMNSFFELPAYFWLVDQFQSLSGIVDNKMGDTKS